jgi:ABC-type nitrate/sulfonate/bicarbonate transport system permease component
MSSPRRKFNDRIASRLVQVGFLAAVLLLWYLATTRWGVNKLLLPNPLNVWNELSDVIAKGEYLDDLRITLTELGVAFLISTVGGTLLGYAISRSLYLIKVFEPLFAGI